MEQQPNVTSEVSIVSFSYADIIDETRDLSEKIKEAFGPNGYGICIVTDVPNYVECRGRLLPLAQKLSKLPAETLKNYEFPDYFYTVGWSHGREKFLNQRDFSKGSFYANPQYDNIHGDAEIKVGETFAPNVWPTKDVPELEQAFKDLGCLIVSVGAKLSKHIDAYIKKEVPTFPQGKVTEIVENSKCCKARLLHYFPSKDEKDADGDWCGWHNDHGLLTGLASAMYFDAEGNEIAFKDPESGLFIQKRSNEIKKAAIPKDALAFQIGESAQILSGGAVQATPHTVLRGKKLIGTGITRDTFAVFMQPNKDELLVPPTGVERQNAIVKTEKVPKLEDRWEENQTFDQFATKTVGAYSNIPETKA